jgi:hypothetical protein
MRKIGMKTAVDCCNAIFPREQRLAFLRRVRKRSSLPSPHLPLPRPNIPFISLPMRQFLWSARFPIACATAPGAGGTPPGPAELPHVGGAVIEK